MGMFDRFFGNKSSVDKVVGGTKREQRAVRKEMRRRFDDQDGLGELGKYERDKTEFELEAIRLVNEEIDSIREKYGLAPFEVPADKVHILLRTPETEKNPNHAFFTMGLQVMALIEGGSRTETLKFMFHEMTHFKSFASVQPVDGEIVERRAGLISGQRERSFVPLNEAVTEALTKRFMNKSADHPLISDESKLKRDAIGSRGTGDGSDDAFVRRVRNHDGTFHDEIMRYTYPLEREALDLLIDKLKTRNPQVFRDKEEWFDMFASAMFNGHLLELARVIEKTFGAGKFRELGEQKDGAQMLKFVESL